MLHRDRRHYVPGRGCELCPLGRAAGRTGWHVSRRLTPAFPPDTHTALGLHPCGLHGRPDGSPCGFSCEHCPAGSCQCQALLEASPHAICAQQTQALSASWQGPSLPGRPDSQRPLRRAPHEPFIAPRLAHFCQPYLEGAFF